MAKDWSLKGWQTERPLTLLEAFGVSKEKMTFPSLNPRLPAVSAANQQPIATSVTGGNNAPGKNNANVPPKGKIQNYAKKLLTAHNWQGSTQWVPFVKVVMAESGWNPHIKNPSSGAYGIAQALGHGTQADQGTESDNYGGYGLTHKEAKQANSGDAYMQLKWMMNYIQQVYGTPSNAWAYHVAHNSY